MICPFCAEDVPAFSQKHHGCKAIGCQDKPFPPFYLDHHGGDGAEEPVVLSVVGFPHHGKTVYLCALFDYLDDHLTYLWRNNFHNLVLDQASLSLLNDNRRLLREGKLPDRTNRNFLRPGIFRLTNMPRTSGGNGLPPLVDTTVLIYDPPGEAFKTEDKIVEFASFVKRSSCVLFLIDLTALGTSIAHGMAELLDTYVLGMRRMGIPKKSQHMIVVYTKSDDMKVSVPEFAGLLEREPALRDYLDQQRPATLSDPGAHLKQLQDVSRLLNKFTWDELNAARFIHVAEDWFASVSYTAVSSLGAAPEETRDESGNVLDKRITFEVSPRGVADPLLYVLAKSLKEPLPPPPPPPPPPKGWLEELLDGSPSWALPALIAGAGVLALAIILTLLAWAWPGDAADRNRPANKTTNTRQPVNSNVPAKPAAPKGMVYVPGGEFIMGSTGRDEFERPPHRVSVEPFFIDLYEVTCADYARFVEQTGHVPPPGWDGALPPAGTARRPVTNVSWHDAVAYAGWAGRRLPTEEEWEFAARGTDGRSYPWGMGWQEGMANAGGHAGGGVADVGSFKGVSPNGCFDMVGNVWEWTASPLAPYPGGPAAASKAGDFRVIRGGSWSTPKEQATTTYRGYLASNSSDTDKTGFRCARDVTN
jgi:formylglycine-generating enzyme required for sulfatase activity